MAIDRILRVTTLADGKYAAYSWRCAPNTTVLTPPVNTLTTIPINTELYDNNNIGTLSNNSITLLTGEYYFTCSITVQPSTGTTTVILYNDNNSLSIVTQSVSNSGTDSVLYSTDFSFRFTLAADTSVSLRALASGVGNSIGRSTAATTPLIDRALLQFWKID